MPLTVSNIIDIAKISQYLSTIDVEEGTLYGKRVVPETPKILYNVRKGVEWMYDHDPANTSLTETSNYLYSLCRGYNLEAQQISGTGGTITPVNPTEIPNPYDFEVSATSIIPDGANSAVLSDFIGFNLLFVRNGIPQSTLNIGGNSYFSWNKALGIITISPVAFAGEQFQLYPV